MIKEIESFGIAVLKTALLPLTLAWLVVRFIFALGAAMFDKMLDGIRYYF